MRFGSSPRLAPLGRPENKFCTHTCWSISCCCTDPERELYRYPPLLREPFLRPSELKWPEPQMCPNLEAPSVGAALTSKGLHRCATAPIESFTSSVPYLHMKMACFQVHLNQGLIWLPPSLSILSCVAAGGLTLQLQMVSSQPFICDYLWQKHYQNLYGARELSVCRVGPFLSGPQRA